MLTKLPLAVLAATLPICNVGAADEFELYGYKQGMTLEQARQIAVPKKSKIAARLASRCPNPCRIRATVCGNVKRRTIIEALRQVADNLEKGIDAPFGALDKLH
jgi:hypothetical protein